MVAVRRNIDMVNPDVGSLVDGNGITGAGQNLLDLKVSDNDVAGGLDNKTDTV